MFAFRNVKNTAAKMLFGRAFTAATVAAKTLSRRLTTACIPFLKKYISKKTAVRFALVTGSVALAVTAAKALSYRYQTIHGTSLENRLMTSVLSSLLRRHPHYEQFRRALSQVPKVQKHVDPLHSHGEEADNRSRASAMAVNWAKRLGHRPFFMQMSLTDVRRGYAGARSYYWAGDTKVPASYDTPQDGDCIVMVDTDYYIDQLPGFLAHHAKPIIIYTQQPRTAASVGQMSHTFDSDGRLCVRVAGGASYNHHLWDFSTDIITVTKSVLGFKTKSVTYNVERRNVSNSHCLVALVPMTSASGLIAATLHSRLSSSLLKRLNPVSNGFIRLRVTNSTGHVIHIGKVGAYVDVELTPQEDTSLALFHKLGSNPITIPKVKRIVKRLDDHQAALVVDFLRSEVRFDPADVMELLVPEIKEYQPASSLDFEAKSKIKTFMRPLYCGLAYAPIMSQANAKLAIEERVTKRATTVRINRRDLQFINDFVEELFKEPGYLIPLEDEQVYARQVKPGQRQQCLNDETAVGPEDEMARAFIKAETYAKATDPRIITPVNQYHKFRYMAYIYPLMSHMKKKKWYASGMTPLEIAQRVTTICCDAKRDVAATDYSRFDGTFSNMLRELFRSVLMRAYGPAESDNLGKLYNKMFNLRVSLMGLSYDTLNAVASGAPDTSVIGSVANAFVSYYALRLDGMTSAEAYRGLGVYSGDDGLTADVSPQNIKRAATIVGLAIDFVPVNRYDRGVVFLNRHFGPDVWTGDPNSCCDIARQVVKFHTTHNLPHTVRPVEKLRQKLISYYMTDRNTPILGEIASFIDSMLVKDVHSIRSWHSRYDAKVQFPNVREDWMFDLMEEQLPDFDYGAFKNWISTIHKIDDVLTCPCFGQTTAEPDTKVPMVIIGHDLATEQDKNAPTPDAIQGVEMKRESISTPAGHIHPAAPPESVVTTQSTVPPESVVTTQSTISSKSTTPLQVYNNKQKPTFVWVKSPPKTKQKWKKVTPTTKTNKTKQTKRKTKTKKNGKNKKTKKIVKYKYVLSKPQLPVKLNTRC